MRKIKDNLVYIFISCFTIAFVCGLIFAFKILITQEFFSQSEMATKDDLTEIIKDKPCAFDEISTALSFGPISKNDALYLANKCEKNRITDFIRDEQRAALSDIRTERFPTEPVNAGDFSSVQDDIDNKERAATRQELIDIISASPCAIGPVTDAIAGMPVSISYARQLGSTCEAVSAQRQRIKQEREEQAQALSHFYE
ncbi:hypothetical protein [Klebsiella sp. GW_Kp182]|uniref:hypothetical protein n=1 Tax=Klebsiella sp. GW_Kp182 TaxID=3153493 RepID=UPI0032B3F702